MPPLQSFWALLMDEARNLQTGQVFQLLEKLATDHPSLAIALISSMALLVWRLIMGAIWSAIKWIVILALAATALHAINPNLLAMLTHKLTALTEQQQVSPHDSGT